MRKSIFIACVASLFLVSFEGFSTPQKVQWYFKKLSKLPPKILKNLVSDRGNFCEVLALYWVRDKFSSNYTIRNIQYASGIEKDGEIDLLVLGDPIRLFEVKCRKKNGHKIADEQINRFKENVDFWRFNTANEIAFFKLNHTKPKNDLTRKKYLNFTLDSLNNYEYDILTYDSENNLDRYSLGITRLELDQIIEQIKQSNPRKLRHYGT